MRPKVLSGTAALAFIWLAGQVWAGSIPAIGDQPVLQPDIVQPVAVFGPDQRTDLPDQYGALEGKIGMLYEQSTQTLCTAFCVGKGVIATAAHCLFQPKNNKLPDLNEVTFRLSYGKAYQTSGIAGRHTDFAKNSIAVGTTAFNNEPPLSAPKDWALAKLERPICRFGTLKVETRSVEDLINKSQQKKIFQVAYHWDYTHWLLAYSQPCTVSRDFDQIKWRFIRQHFVNYNELVLHDCDTGGASSGSPILMDSGAQDGVTAVAINVGTYTRTRILLREGRIVKRLKPDIIANTAVNGTAFAPIIQELEGADIIASNEDMMRLQTGLQELKFYNGVADGQMGRGLRAAIIEFEKWARMPQTGLPTKALLRRMDEDGVKASHTLSTMRSPVAEPPRPSPTPRPNLNSSN